MKFRGTRFLRYAAGVAVVLLSFASSGRVTAAGPPGLSSNATVFVSGLNGPRGLTFGTSGRNVLNNPPRTNFDMGLFKRFAITEARAFEFRAEGFNVFNHTQWSGIHSGDSCFAGPNNSAGDPSCIAGNSFLHPNGAHNPRILQLGMKFLF